MSALVILDVLAGLVFIYLLYSLLATTIVEFIAGVFGLRARNLEWTIARMLSDQVFHETPLVNKILLFFNGVGRLFYRKRKNLLGVFFDLPEIKYSSEGGLFNQPSYLSNETFSRSLTEALKKYGQEGDSVLFNDQEKIEAGLMKMKDEAGDSYRHLTILWQEASKDTTKFRSLIEAWFEQMNDRATGWYKRKVQLLLLFIGLFIAYWSNLDTIAMANRLATDNDARNQLVALALERAAQSEDSSDIQKALKVAEDSLTSAINDADKILGSGWSEGKTYAQKWCHIRNQNLGTGYLITALAISMGAPFWFDLLGKLVRLRSSLPQPTSNQQGRNNTGRPSSSSTSGTGNETIPARRRKG